MRNVEKLKLSDKEFFRKFNDKIIFEVYSQFYVWKHLQIKENEKGYRDKPNFWKLIISTLLQSFLLNLANIFDENRKVLSVYNFLNQVNDSNLRKQIKKSIDSQKNIIKNLIVWRSNFFAHRNLYYVFNQKELEKRFKLKNEDIENLLELLVDILDKTKKYFDLHDITNYQQNYIELEERCKKDLDFTLKRGLNLKNNHGSNQNSTT